MGTEMMGRVTVAAKMENAGDLFLVHEGKLRPEQVRTVQVSDALVDTGATNLSMPGSLIKQLNLIPLRGRVARTTAGNVTVRVFGGVRLTVQGRDCTIDVTEVPENCPVLIGQVALELLDFVVDPKGQQLIGNPAHGGEQMFEL